jgi:hypothetical protein
MKSFSIQQVRIGIFVFIVAVVLVAVYMNSQSFLNAPKVGASTGDNLSGYAWANTPQSSGSPTAGTDQGIGWISFNSTNETGPTSAYGVNVDTSNKATGGTGDFSGYAYMGNGAGAGDTGWIWFAPTGGYPAAPFHGAQIDWSTGKVTGWARACSGTVNNDCVSAPRTDGWDGWISLSGTASNGSTYGVSVSNGNFAGFAWGSDVLGWIWFGVTVNGAFFGTQLGGGGSCSPSAVPSSSWGTCQVLNAPTTCTAPGGNTMTGLPGTTIGVCANGVTTSPQPCNTASYTCPVVSGTGGIKIKYQQF